MYHKYFATFPSKEDVNFNRKILERKEFNEFIEEKRGVLPNKLIWYQEMSIRYFGPHTPINRGIINGDPGVGKTWIALGLVRQYTKWNKNMKHPIILVKNDTGAEIFKKLNKIFFPGKTHVSKATDVTKGHNISTSKQMPFRILKYGKFVKNFQDKDESFYKAFGKRLIVCDEIHNLRKLEGSEKQLYKNIKEIFQKLKDSIIIGLTATLMVDRAEEFASIFNIIMGKDLIDSEILKQCLHKGKHKVKDYLEPLVRGSIIHIPKKEGIKNITMVGKYDPNLQANVTKIKISKYHQELIKEKRENRIKYIFANPFIVTLDINSTQSFTFLNASVDMIRDPHDTLTKEVEKAYGKDNTLYINNYLIREGGGNTISITFKESSSEDLYNQNDDIITYYHHTVDFFNNIENIKSVSKVFYKTLKIINMEKYKDSIGFIYLPYIEYGVNILRKILELNGYVYYKGKEKIKFNMKETVKRFAIISGSTKPQELANIMSKLNMEHNSTGKIIKLIIGTDVTKESINFPNAQFVIKIIPAWNSSTSWQIDQRVNRVDSQLSIPEEKRFIDNWNLVAITNRGESFIEKTIRSAVEKQKRISLVEEVIKETSFTSYYFINEKRIKPKHFLTYFRYYFDKQPVIKRMVDKLILEGYIDKKDLSGDKLLTMVIDELAKQQMLIRNRFGLHCFIRKKEDRYFLSYFKNFDDSLYSNMVATILETPKGFSTDHSHDYSKIDKVYPFVKERLFEQSFIDGREDIYTQYPDKYRIYDESEIVISTFGSKPRILYYEQRNLIWRDATQQEISIYLS